MSKKIEVIVGIPTKDVYKCCRHPVYKNVKIEVELDNNVISGLKNEQNGGKKILENNLHILPPQETDCNCCCR